MLPYLGDWRRTRNGVKVAFTLRDSARATLGTCAAMIFNYRVSKNLRDILVQGKNGTLVCETADAKRRLFFAEGLLIGSRSSREDERLGSVLVKKRRITAPQLAQATDQIRTGKKLGHILVELGFLTEEDIARYVRGQVVDVSLQRALGRTEAAPVLGRRGGRASHFGFNS